MTLTDPTPLLVCTVLLGAVVTYLAFVLVSYHRDGRTLGVGPREDLWEPSPPTFLVGNLFTFQQNMSRIQEFVLEIVQASPKERSPTLTSPFQRTVLLRTPEELEYIQHTNFKNYAKGKNQHDNMNVLGDGIFTTDGSIWSAQRKATSKIFTANAFRGLITDSVDETLAKLRAKLADLASSGEAFDLRPLFFAFTLDSFSLLAFGTAIGALSQDTPLPFATAFDYVQTGMARRFFEPMWKVTERYTEEGRRMKEETSVIDRFVYDLIEKRERAAEGVEMKEDLLSLYMKLRLDDGSKLSKVGIRDSVLNLLIAGRDTTAQNLAWISFHLLTRPEILAKVRHELENSPPVTYDTFKGLVYLNAVFNEGVRLHPAVPTSSWTALGPDKIANGPRKGDVVSWSDWAMGRLPSIWGEDAKEFKPERWINEDGSLKTASSWKLHGFNGGYRLCLGKTLATFESITVLSLLAENFDLSLATGWLENVEMASTEQTPMYAFSLTLPMKHPLMVHARVREGR